jgi:DNA repair protein RadA/Sms
MPRRVGTGVDPKRLAMIVAVLGRHARIPLASADVFVNVAGGPVREGLAAFGEIGLTGRLRQASQAERRLEECAKLGVAAVVAPSGTPTRTPVRLVEAETLRAAITAGLEASAAAEAAA